MPVVSLLYQWFLVSFTFLLPSPVMKEGQKAQGLHPFYIAVTEINHNAKDKNLEVSCKMFAEDLEQILEKTNKSTLDITSDKDKAAFDRYIPDYIGKHLTLTVDGKTIKLSYIGFEQEKGSAFCYFEADNIASFKKLKITNTILHDFTDQQTNIVHVVQNGQRKSTKLEYPAKDAEFTF